MLVQKQFLEKLKDHFNLNIYEVKIWTALLSRGIASAGQLSEISDVPRSRSYDVLESLEKKGFVIMKLGRPIKYIAVQPEEIVDRIKKNVKKETEFKLSMIDQIRDTDIFKELELLHKHGIEHVDVTDLSGALTGRKNVYYYIKSLVENSKKSVVMVTTPKDFSRKVDIMKNALKRAKRRGVKITVHTPQSKEISKAKKLVGDAVDIKHTNKIDSRFVIVDNREIVFLLNDDKEVQPSYDTAVWVKSPFFVKAVSSMFKNLI